jgi:thiosulfate/3-mercaptopyruvate sulfurtransferase
MGPVIDAAELLDRLDAVRVIDARAPDGRAAYEEGHIRGALFADWGEDLSAPGANAAQGGRHPLPPIDVWARTLGRLGIRSETAVVVYDDAGGAMAAARLWWMLRASGHRDVAVLDSGLAAARAAGIPIDRERAAVAPVEPYPVTAWTLPIVDIDEVESARRDPGRVVIDVRAPERYRGESETIDPVAGHIPGARNVPLSENLAGGRWKPPEELRAMYRRVLGDVPPERTVVHCGSGITACHTLLALARAGLPGAALYVGSWSEWCRTGRPIATGSEPGR